MTILRRPELFCSCFHEGGPDLAAPPESQGSTRTICVSHVDKEEG
jgi:hypothetical protein